MKPRSLVRLGALLAACSLAAACTGAAVAPGPTTPISPATPGAKSAEVPLEKQAEEAAQRGALDVAAHLLGRVAERDRSAQAHLAHARALVEAWAFEEAGRVLDAIGKKREPDDVARKAAEVRAAIPLVTAAPIDAGVVDRALSAFVSRDAPRARDLLAPLAVPGAPPTILALLGRAQSAAGEAVPARKSFARARSRIDASGGRLGLVAAEAAAVEHVALDRGRLVLARRRDLRLAGGYEAMNGFDKRIEVFAPGDPEPLLHVPTGHVDALSTNSIQPVVAIIDRPIGLFGGPPTATLRILDLRTGGEVSSAEVKPPHLLVLSADGKELAAARGDTLLLLDLAGRETRRTQLTGQTPGIIRAYTGQGSHHHNIPTQYPSRAVHLERDADGTLLAALTDGSIWVVGPGASAPLVLPPPRGKPADERDARASQALDLRREGDSLTAVYGDGSIRRWDLKSKRSTEVAAPRCTDAEIAEWGLGGSKPADAAAQCAGAHKATLSLDGSRAILGGGLGGMRVRDARDGRFITTLATLAREGLACEDTACSRAWLAGVDGRVERWDTTTGQAALPLAQSGVSGFVRGLSADGRFVVVDDVLSLGYKVPSRIGTHIWDTVTGAPVPMPDGYETGALLGARSVLVADAKGRDTLLFDLETRRKIATVTVGEGDWSDMSSDGRRVVNIRERTAIVREGGRELRRFEMEGAIFGVSMSRDGRRLCLFDDKGNARVFDTDAGAELIRKGPVAGATLSADGAHLALRADRSTAVVVELATGREVGSVTAAELKQTDYPETIRDIAFTGGGAELALVGPGAPGYMRMYLWRPGEDPRPTELQMLGTNRIQPGSEGVVQVLDRNDTMHLLRLSDGKLLASVYSAHGGWAAQSPTGAVDAPEAGRGAFLSFTEGLSRPLSFGASVAWDRFHTPGLLARAARGELPEPPMPGPVRATETLRAAGK